MERSVTYILSFLLVFLFILEGESDDHLRISAALLLAGLIALVAFLLRWISLDAIGATTLFGGYILGLGGLLPALLVLLFFVSSSLLTSRKEREPGRQSEPSRNELQIWSNGFWILFCVLLWFLFRTWEAMIMTASVIAAVTADTWATELGSRNPGPTRLITSWKQVPPGTDGGISLKGTAGGFLGACSIATLFWLISGDASPGSVAIIAGSGFVGCLADSLIGASIQGRPARVAHAAAPLSFPASVPHIPIMEDRKNSFTNWYSSGAAALFSGILSSLYLWF